MKLITVNEKTQVPEYKDVPVESISDQWSEGQLRQAKTVITLLWNRIIQIQESREPYTRYDKPNKYGDATEPLSFWNQAAPEHQLDIPRPNLLQKLIIIGRIITL